MLQVTEIQEAVNKIAPKYPISQVHLFGSYAEGGATQDSDVDVLVEFMERPITLLDFCGFQQELSEMLRVNVDVLQSPLSEVANRNMTINKMVHLFCCTFHSPVA